MILLKMFAKFVAWWEMFLEMSKKVFTNVSPQQFTVGWVKPHNIVFFFCFFQCFYYFAFAVDVISQNCMKVLAFICHVLKKKKYNPKNTELSRDDG